MSLCCSASFRPRASTSGIWPFSSRSRAPSSGSMKGGNTPRLGVDGAGAWGGIAGVYDGPCFPCLGLGRSGVGRAGGLREAGQVQLGESENLCWVVSLKKKTNRTGGKSVSFLHIEKGRFSVSPFFFFFLCFSFELEGGHRTPKD